MKTKTKILASVEIAVVLCSLFLVALPVIAAEQNQEMQKVSASEVTIASEDDYILGVYGNANEDDTIDMRDLTYVKLIFFGKKPETELADAKYDGKINPLDFIQIKLIIVGKEKELTIVDSMDRIVTVKKPIKRIIPFSSYVTEVMQSLKATDKIVAVPDYVTKDKKLFPELADLPCVGNAWAIDYEKIVELRPDLLFWYTHGGADFDEAADKFESLLPSTPLVRISCTTPDIYIEDVRKMGYILDRDDEAEELLDFREECLNQIDEKVEALSDDEKPRVFYTYPSYFPGTYYTANRLGGAHPIIVRAGGINIAADIGVGGGGSPTIDPEWVIVQNPEIIIGTSRFGYKMGDATEADVSALRDKIMLHPAWGHIAAVESGKVYLLDSKLVTMSGQHFIGTAYMAKLLHPELFDDLDPQAMHQEYLDRFQGFDFDVYEDGVFVYPPFE